MSLFQSLIVGGVLIGLLNSSLMAEEGSVVKGKISLNEKYAETWDGHALEVPLSEIETRLFERVTLPPVPFPDNWSEMNLEQRQAWLKEFEASDKGKTFIAKREKLLDEAHEFDVKIEKDGDFVVYDVPPATYGLQGMVEKKFGDTNYRFEIFGQIEVLQEVDEIALAPLQVEITPLLEAGAKAPPIQVKAYDGKSTISLETFQDHYLFVQFLVTGNTDPVYQRSVQKMYAEVKAKHPLRLLSICVDEDTDQAVKYLRNNDLKLGSYGFTKGFEHRTLFEYGVRTLPTYWLVSPDGTIAMTPLDFAKAFQQSDNLSEIVASQIEGKDLPEAASSE